VALRFYQAMDPEFLSIREAAEQIGVSVSTLRRWDESGKLKSVRNSPEGHRYYSKRDVEIYLSDLFKLARDWVFDGVQPPQQDYCPDSYVFQARLVKLGNKLAETNNEEIKNLLPLVVSVAGEIGNNSFDHNLGNWPDDSGIFFAYDVNKRKVVLADRGQGILGTLKRVKPELRSDEEALKIAFTEFVSGRQPEKRGNGLKYVRKVVGESLTSLYFQTGNAELEVKRGDHDLRIKNAGTYFRGCIAVINF
jgi:excisionase family DNA binding protein